MSSLPPSTDHRTPPLGTVLSGRYRLDRFLGAGGMGAVYGAATQQGGEVAIKVLFQVPAGSGADPASALARFIREAQVTSSLQSPYLVRVFDGGIDETLRLPYLAMELLNGEDIDALVMRVGPLHPVTAVRLALQTARGLAVAHAAGIVHRDIKPSNVFLDLSAEQVALKICDFGLAKARTEAGETSLTRTGSVLGSPLYMAPEQLVSAKRVDARADVWSLGMTLYQMLAGIPALHRMKTFTELAIAVSTQEIPHLQDAAPWIEPGLAAVVHGALIRDVEGRCPSVDAFASALIPFAANAETVTRDMLNRVPDELTKTVAPRAAYPLSWETTGASLPQSQAGAEVHDPLLGKRLAGKYELIRIVGQGGMGAVYEATDPNGVSVAVKVIHLDHLGTASVETLGRFVREARSAMSIHSPHVVRVLDADTDPTYRVPFIVMEMLRGADLDRVIKDTGAIEPRALCAVFRDACAGLAAAHDLGIVHRDVKPANIFLHEEQNGQITVKICDFGVAKQTHNQEGDQGSTDLTRTGGIVGSPMYMSPEQARNAKSVDARSDVWSLAISMHQALSGRRPWEGCGTVGELIVAICTQPMVALQEVAPWIEPGVAEVVHRGLTADPNGRFASARELGDAIAPFADKSPITRRSLGSLSSADRGVVTQRGPSASLRQHSPGATTAHATTLDRTELDRPERKSPLPWVVGVAALVIGTGVAVILAKPFSKPQTPTPATSSLVAQPTASASTTAQASATSPLQVRLPISPATADVQVAGATKTLGADGSLLLEGQPGDVFDVVVSQGKTRVEQKVVLSKDGTATPASIELPGQKVGAVAHPVDTSTTAPVASTTKPKDPVTVTATPTPTPAGGNTPKPKDTW